MNHAESFLCIVPGIYEPIRGNGIVSDGKRIHLVRGAASVVVTKQVDARFPPSIRDLSRVSGGAIAPDGSIATEWDPLEDVDGLRRDARSLVAAHEEELAAHAASERDERSEALAEREAALVPERELRAKVAQLRAEDRVARAAEKTLPRQERAARRDARKRVIDAASQQREAMREKRHLAERKRLEARRASREPDVRPLKIGGAFFDPSYILDALREGKGSIGVRLPARWVVPVAFRWEREGVTFVSIVAGMRP